MAKSKKTKSTAKPSVKVHDLEPEKDPKGGAYDAFLKIESPTHKLSNTFLKIGSSSYKFNK